MSSPARAKTPPKPPDSETRRTERALLPAVDERLVMPETRFEIIDGEVFDVAPSDEPHGTLHAGLAALLMAHVAPGLTVALDMLTRTSKKGDMAPDASVFPIERDPETGGRKIEELAFEVVSTEALSHAARKARALLGRGVRRVFAIDVSRGRLLEWSRSTDAWQLLSEGSEIEDETLIRPLSASALVNATQWDDTVARGLLAKKNPVLEEAIDTGRREGRAKGKIEGKAEGKTEGKAEALLLILQKRGFRIKKKAIARIRAATSDELDTLLALSVTCSSADDMLKS